MSFIPPQHVPISDDDSSGRPLVSRPWYLAFDALRRGVAEAAAAGGGTPPGDATGFSVSGIVDPITSIITLTISATPPAGDFVGLHFYLECPDLSADTSATLGSVALGDGTVASSWTPIDLGQQPWVASQQPWTLTLPLPAGLDPTTDTPARLYGASYTATVDNDLVRATEADPTPSVAFTVVSLVSGSPTAGTNITAVPGDITAQVLPDDNTTGKLKTPVLVLVATSPGTIPGWSCRLVLTWAATDPTLEANQQVMGEVFTTAGPVYGSPDGIPIPHSFALDTPKTVKEATVWAQAGLLDASGAYQWNNIVPGITPSCGITIGTTTGTTDAASVMASSIAATMAVVANLFGVAPLGISNPYMGTGAVATLNLQALAVTNPILAALAVDAAKLGSSSVTSTKIANLAVGTAAIQLLAVDTGIIANLAISGAKIQSATITGANIALATIADANIGSCNVSKLLAGTATFTGDVTLSRGVSQPSVVLASTGVTIQAGSNALIATSSSVSIQNGTNILSASSTGVTASAGSNSCIVTSSGVQLTGPSSSQAVLNASGITISQGSNSVAITSSSLTIQQGSSVQVVLTSTDLSMKTGTLAGIAVNSAGNATFTSSAGTSTSILGNSIGTGSISTVSLSVSAAITYASPLAYASATSGGATLPANPAGFLLATIGVSSVKIPYYAF